MNMLTMIMGLLDIISALCFFLLPGSHVGFRLVLGCSLYLAGKGYLFRGDLLSIIDAIIGGLLLISFVLTWKFLCILLGTYLIIKGSYSIFASFL